MLKDNVLRDALSLAGASPGRTIEVDAALECSRAARIQSEEADQAPLK